MMRFAYFYLMADDADRVGEVAPDHAAYWQDLQLDGYEGGPFADRSGGLIVFAADSVDHAGEQRRALDRCNDPSTQTPRRPRSRPTRPSHTVAHGE